MSKTFRHVAEANEETGSKLPAVVNDMFTCKLAPCQRVNRCRAWMQFRTVRPRLQFHSVIGVTGTRLICLNSAPQQEGEPMSYLIIQQFPIMVFTWPILRIHRSAALRSAFYNKGELARKMLGLDRWTGPGCRLCDLHSRRAWIAASLVAGLDRFTLMVSATT